MRNEADTLTDCCLQGAATWSRLLRVGVLDMTHKALRLLRLLHASAAGLEVQGDFEFKLRSDWKTHALLYITTTSTPGDTIILPCALVLLIPYQISQTSTTVLRAVCDQGSVH
jgi:hypothetical protein